MEEKVKTKVPKSSLRAPHKHSQLQHFRGVYNAVHDMVVGSCKIGFRWDVERKSVVAKSKVWKAYMKRGKPCPYCEDLCIVFGKYRASRRNTQGHEEIKDEEENEESSKKDEPESSSTQEPFGVETYSGKSVKLGKRTRVTENLVKGLSEVTSVFVREIRVASSEISRAVKCLKINEELTKLGLITMEGIEQPENLHLILGWLIILDIEKEDWVLVLLRGYIYTKGPKYEIWYCFLYI
ncbi:hypothetical protein Cgig2_013489 [Carnegiea gigantea]|uniref:Uncharacterized protein n=1 Tax=Carnegiea gigantea TaxID=171969 RepID=A0A9Q1GPU1_9CARY|nr:hypothetical protein Cgig2_013489 [Carnegiea gigantea]